MPCPDPGRRPRNALGRPAKPKEVQENLGKPKGLRESVRGFGMHREVQGGSWKPRVTHF